MHKNYAVANLVPLLERIRTPGRYAGLDGVNALTNAAPYEAYSRGEVTQALRAAVAAGAAGNRGFTPQFTHPAQGLAFGLNPYTDWSLAQLVEPPSHYYLFLGLDWYAISGLGQTESWFDYLKNPFVDQSDRYWHRLWAWILRLTNRSSAAKESWRTPVSERDAAEYIRKDGAAFIFHNMIPYLRPAGLDSSGTNWYKTELKKRAVHNDVIDDLRVLRQLTGNRVGTVCTGQKSKKALLAAGYSEHQILCLGAHPSQVFHPSIVARKNLWFGGRECFGI